MGRRIAAYLRVSTKEQNTDLQKDAIASFTRYKNYSNVTYFIDHDESGSKTSRPALDEMLLKVRKKEFDAIVVWKLDRLGRSAGHLITLLDELNSLKVDFISLCESMDSTTPMGKAMFGVMAVMAQLERDNISMRTKAALETIKSRGVKLGRPEKFSDDQRKDLIYLRGQGLTIDELCKVHPRISRAQIARIVRHVVIKKETV